jgi:iron complex outermembrane receptor protein
VQVLQFQTLPTGQVILVLSNAAEAESKGVELELTYRITDGLSITTNAAYNDAKYTRFPDGGGPGIDYDGNRLIFAPEWTAYAALEYRLPVGAGGYASFLADYSYTDENYFSPNNLPQFRTPAFDEVNARVTWAPNEHWELAAWVKNVTDAVNIRSHQIGFTGNEVFTYNPPRMYGLKATYRF